MSGFPGEPAIRIAAPLPASLDMLGVSGGCGSIPLPMCVGTTTLPSIPVCGSSPKGDAFVRLSVGNIAVAESGLAPCDAAPVRVSCESSLPLMC